MQQIREEIERKGYSVLRDYIPHATSIEASQTLGQEAVMSSVNNVQVLKPHTKSQSSPNTYSGNYGLEEFPLHTDLAHWFLPPRYLALRCIRGVDTVTTHLLDSKKVIDELGEANLRRALVRPRRPVNNSNFIFPIYGSIKDSIMIFRWDKLFIRPATESCAQIFKALSDKLQYVPRTELALTSEGDTLILDNWRMLHGRSAVPVNAESRHIERTYLRTLN